MLLHAVRASLAEYPDAEIDELLESGLVTLDNQEIIGAILPEKM